MIQLILLRSTIATLVAWTGGFVGAVIGGAARTRLIYFVTAALGALLAVTLFDVLPDAKELLPWPVFILATFSGMLLFWLVARFIYPICPACSLPGEGDAPPKALGASVLLLMVALGMHSTMDGAAVVIGDALARGANAGVFFAVSLHKFPEGLALVLLLIGSGMRRRTALFYTIGIEAATELGALGALVLVGRLSHFALGAIFANIGGGFLYLVLSTLLIERHEAADEGGSNLKLASALTAIFGFSTTCGIMYLSEAITH